MPLMLTLEDATKVCAELIRTYAEDVKLCEEDIEGIKSDLEQKCYLYGNNHDHFKELNNLIMDINPAEIAQHVQDDNLKEWCRNMQVTMNMELIQLERGNRNDTD